MDKHREQRYVEALKKSSEKIKELLEELDSLKKGEPVAIIGMGCRFAGGADSPEKFWELLEQGKDTIVEVPPDRWPIDQYYDPDAQAAGKMYSRYGGFLDEVDKFDCSFFGISPREAASLDPQQRLLLEVSWEALENAGQSIEALKESATGVYIGIFSYEYGGVRLVSGILDEIDPYSVTGVAHSIAAGRISYLFGFQGPNMAIDTSCSSSLVALHLAAASLQRRESNLALAGGVNFIISPECQIGFSKLNALSPDGHCKTFDASADGIGRGEGCGIVVLKRLSDALCDRDPILAVIKGSALNQDGTSNGLTAPNGIAQQQVIRQALKNAQLSPQDVSYIEAHGTGTPLGDPIEIRSLTKIFPDQELCIGSVKTNLGHLESAAGVAGLMKVILSLEHEKIPPHLHFNTPNPHISWDELSFIIPKESNPWPKTEKPRIAGVSAFGLSGTNAHVLIGEAPKESERVNLVERPLHILNLSAKKEESLRELALRYQEYLDQMDNTAKTEMGDICYTANTGRSHFPKRLSVIGESITAIKQKLSEFLKGTITKGCFQSTDSAKINLDPVFLFTGQGSQYCGMGRGLYETQPLFKEVLVQCDELFKAYLNDSIISLLYSGDIPENIIHQTLYTQSTIFSIEYALAKLWKSWGVKPSVVMGHSVGEYVAACIAGVFSLEDAVKLVATRGKLMQALPSGIMAAAFVEEKDALQMLQGFEDKVSIAAVNTARSVVISGETESIHAVLAKFKEADTSFRYQLLKVSHAFHSPMMGSILEEFRTVALQINYSKPKLPIISNLTGKPIQVPIENSPLDWAKYWTRHIREPVRFYDSINYLEQEGYELFLEIGATPILSGLGIQNMSPNKGLWLPSLRQEQDNWGQILDTLAHLYIHGLKIDWTGFDRPYSRRKVILPNYPFQRERHWVEPKHFYPNSGNKKENPCLNERQDASLPSISQEKAAATETRGNISEQRESSLEKMMNQQHQTLRKQMEVMSRQLRALKGRDGVRTDSALDDLPK
ncbi:MAG: type I polyketide synthase [SAR324 cluster bacterium]|nr:type I polyketide synthase [SAR324 cluster bacterium]